MEKQELVPLLIVKQNAIIAQAFEEMESVSNKNKERFVFIKKQLEDMKREDQTAEKKFWELAEVVLKTLNIDEEGPFTLRDGVIYKGDDRSGGLDGLLSALFGRKL